MIPVHLRQTFLTARSVTCHYSCLQVDPLECLFVLTDIMMAATFEYNRFTHLDEASKAKI